MQASQALTALAPLACLVAAAQEAPPEGAMKFHAALLNSPANATLFDRFFNAWIDERPVESLAEFLAARAGTHGGADLALLARFQLRRGLDDDALATLAKAIAARPEDPGLTMERAKIFLRRLEFEAARKDFATVAAGNDAALALEAAKLTGKSFLREGKPDEALKAWDALLAAHPDDAELMEDLAESAAAEGQTDQAIGYLDKLIGKSADPYRRTLHRLRRAELLARAGKSDEAAGGYRAALADVGEGSWLEREILAQFEKLFRSQDRIADLKDELRKMAEANPRRLLVHRQLAKLEAAEGEMDAAIGRFREVLRRAPGEAELREEFLKLLTDGGRHADAAEELGKMIALAPGNAELHLRMAALSAAREDPEATLASLEKALALLGGAEPAALRIASLMFGHGLGKEGEALLGKMIAAPGASHAPAEALAAEYARTNREADALTLLGSIAATADVETLIRIASSVSRLGGHEKAHALLKSRAKDFTGDARFLAALPQAALAAQKPAEAISPAMRLVRMAVQESAIQEAVAIAARAIAAAGEAGKWRDGLGKAEGRGIAETCLLAALAESAGDIAEVDRLLAGSAVPLLTRYHAALLERRGDFAAAIAALQSLPATGEGRKASFFKDLSELQIRAGQTENAIGTLAEWQLTAPGDRTPWLISGRLLQSAGRAQEAITSTRRALARFGDDEDLAATLAGLHEAVGSHADAEALYWRFYDSSPDPSSQSRWAAQLSRLAQRTSTTAALQEKFEQRARNNRRSLGPILAQIELARVLQDDVARRDLLQQSLRLQPQRTDLRIQLAGIEEEAGNTGTAIGLLKDGADADKTNSVRSALAQTYIRSGEVLKGTSMLRSIAAGRAGDPRFIESLATTILGAGMPEEAARFLEEALPDGGDWRTQYLLASILEQDGREEEAIGIFIALRDAEGEIAATTRPPQTRNPFVPESYAQSLLQEYFLIYRERRGHGVSRNIRIPTDPQQARLQSLVHLARLSAEGGEKAQKRILGAGVKGIGFARDLIASIQLDGQPDHLALLEKHPAEPGLFDMVMRSGALTGNSGNGTPPDPRVRKLLASRKLDPSYRLQIASMLLARESGDSEAWQALAEAAGQCAESGDPATLSRAGTHILGLLNPGAERLPTWNWPVSSNIGLGIHPYRPPTEVQRQILSGILLRIGRNGKLDAETGSSFRLGAYSYLADHAGWVAETNLLIRAYRQRVAEASKTNVGRSAYNPWKQGTSQFGLPDLGRIWLTSIPMQHVRAIAGKGTSKPSGFRVQAVDLLGHLDAVESPTLRAMIAMKAGKSGLARDILAADAPEGEEYDFQVIRAVLALGDKDLPLAYRCFQEAKPTNPYYQASKEISLLDIAREMTPQQREPFAASLRGILKSAARLAGPDNKVMLGHTARTFGFPDLEDLFAVNAPSSPGVRQPPGNAKATCAAVFTARPVPRSTASPRPRTSPVDRIRKFAAEGKTEAAAREIFLQLRNLRSDGQTSERAVQETVKGCGEEILTALLGLSYPGDSRSLTRRLLHIDICLGLGKTEAAIRELEKLVAERPDDAGLTVRLAFLLPPAPSGRTNALLTRAAATRDFEAEAYLQTRAIQQSSAAVRQLDLLEKLAAWLEETPPEDLRMANLSWISYLSYQLFGATAGLPSLFQPGRPMATVPPDAGRRDGLSKRLAMAMMRHPALAEEGFRLNLASKGWASDTADLDEMARAVLMLAEVGTDGAEPRKPFSFYRGGRNATSDGADLAGFSSMGWLAGRLGKLRMDEVFPPDYLAELRRRNPRIGTLATAFVSMENADALGEFLRSQPVSPDHPMLGMISEAILERGASLPGAMGFFLAEIRSSGDARLTKTAFRIAAGRGGKELEDVCTAIAAALTDGKPDWSPDGDPQKLYAVTNALNILIGDEDVPPRTAVETLRILERLEIPFTKGEQWLMRSLRKTRVPDAGTGISLLASLGMLRDAEEWKPIVTLMPNTAREGSANRLVRERKILTISPNSLSFAISYNDFAKALENHRPRTFGTLICAASFSSGVKRGELAAAAFGLAAPAFAKLPDERLEDFSEFVAWLPDDAIPRLPRFFGNKLKQEKESKLALLLAQVEAASKPSSSVPARLMTDIRPLIPQIAVLDHEKALGLFLGAEQSYTEGLATGGSLSNETSADAMCADRDYCMEQILSSLGTMKGGGPELMLRFMREALDSPGGERFSMAIRGGNNLPLLADIGEKISGHFRGDHLSQSSWHALRGGALSLPPGLQEDALAAAACRALLMQQSADIRSKESIAESTGRSALYRAFVAGTLAFAPNNPDQREGAAEAIVALLTDGEASESNRIQLALLIASHHPAVLAEPSVAEATADLFATYCGTGRSAVNHLSISVVGSIAETTISDTNLPHLKRIQEAFWKNANGPKAGGHPEISTARAKPLFLAALATGDAEIADRLFPLLEPSLKEDFQMLVRLLVDGHHRFAARILPDEGDLDLRNRVSGIYTEKLDESLAAFRKTGANPRSLLMLEAAMLSMDSGNGNGPAPERLERLAATYRKNPPQTREAATVILSALATSHDPASETLSGEVGEFGKSQDPYHTLLRWAGSRDRASRALAEAEWDILCKTAALGLSSGDASVAAKVVAALEKSAGPSDPAHLPGVLAHHRFLSFAMPATCRAISDGTTGAFGALVEPLGALSLALSQDADSGQQHIIAALALCEFLAYWEGKPDAFTAFLKQIDGDTAENPNRIFSFPRDAPTFLNALGRYNRGEHGSMIGPLPEGFPLALFSHPPIGDLLPGTYTSWPDQLKRSNLKDVITKLATEEFPESISPAGRALLLIHRANHFRNVGRRDEVHAEYRASLAVMPPGKPWDYVRTHTKCHVIWEMIEKGQIGEARNTLNSIKPWEISKSSKSFYESLSKTLKTKNDRPD